MQDSTRPEDDLTPMPPELFAHMESTLFAGLYKGRSRSKVIVVDFGEPGANPVFLTRAVSDARKMGRIVFCAPVDVLDSMAASKDAAIRRAACDLLKEHARDAASAAKATISPRLLGLT